MAHMKAIYILHSKWKSKKFKIPAFLNNFQIQSGKFCVVSSNFTINPFLTEYRQLKSMKTEKTECFLDLVEIRREF